LWIDKNLTIDGPGAALLAISGNNERRVLAVWSGAQVTIEGVTIRNGFDTGEGGGILVSSSTLTLINTVVAYNVASQKGGGISSVGSALTLAGCTFHDNSAATGGAISNWLGAPLSSLNTTFSGNFAAEYGGALFNAGEPVIVNNTFSGNEPDSIGSLNGLVWVKNSIFAGAGISQCWSDPPVINLGGNLTTGFCMDTDILVTPEALKLDPVLADNGGPTPTHKLLAGSAAIDAVTDCTTIPTLLVFPPPSGDPVIADQRGVARPQGISCDAGAFEREVDTAELIAALQSLAAAAWMAQGDNNLNNVLKHLTKPAGNMLIPACNNLDAFIKKAGTLAPPQGPAIVAAAQQLKLAIGCP
jgi:predicted outer membrane repeat protein